MANSDDYVLGTSNIEIKRLGLQHAVWRPRALDAWRRAGFRRGQTIVDYGAGPGFASLDLADVAGDTGRVLSWERSNSFLDHLRAETATRGLRQIETQQIDFTTDPLPDIAADGAWARWIFAFLPNPREALAQLASRVRPGGVIVVHEYYDYRMWRLFPRVPSIEAFVAAVIDSWRASGGEPDIAPDVERWLVELGFEIETRQPIADLIDPNSFAWAWPESFVESNLARQVELGRMRQSDAAVALREFRAAASLTTTRMATSGVLEIIARRPKR